MFKRLVMPVLMITLLSVAPSDLQSSANPDQAAYISCVTELSEFNISETDANHVESNNHGAPLLDAEIEDSGVPLLDAEIGNTGVPLLDAELNNDNSLCSVYADSADK